MHAHKCIILFLSLVSCLVWPPSEIAGYKYCVHEVKQWAPKYYSYTLVKETLSTYWITRPTLKRGFKRICKSWRWSPLTLGVLFLIIVPCLPSCEVFAFSVFLLLHKFFKSHVHLQPFLLPYLLLLFVRLLVKVISEISQITLVKSVILSIFVLEILLLVLTLLVIVPLLSTLLIILFVISTLLVILLLIATLINLMCPSQVVKLSSFWITNHRVCIWYFFEFLWSLPSIFIWVIHLG